MGGKRRKLQQRQSQSARAGKSQGAKINKAQKALAKKPQPQQQAQQQNKPKTNQQLRQQQQNEIPTIPFDAEDRILLIGEGDLSFAASIIQHYGCFNVTATVLEKDHKELVEKYPSVDENIAIVNQPQVVVRRHNTHAQGSQAAAEKADYTSDISDTEEQLQQDEYPDSDSDSEETKKKLRPSNNKLFYNTDTTKPLPSSLLRTCFTRIFFNFPHVGGKSTDVNRQVRYNQELLVSFFQRILPALDDGGTIIVTLFEGEPYTLWNVKDLARYAGLQVERSFRFRSNAYPGYKHARTLGVVRSKKSGEVGGGWKGEDRAARSFVFARKGDSVRQPSGMVVPVGRKKKRKRGNSSDDDDNESSGED
jgi:25S rRNA (uracil2634-N3)-methyltransferase